jgi:hypothetical protein
LANQIWPLYGQEVGRAGHHANAQDPATVGFDKILMRPNAAGGAMLGLKDFHGPLD